MGTINYAQKTANLVKKIDTYETSLKEHKDQLNKKCGEINEYVQTFYKNEGIQDCELKVFDYEVYYKFKFDYRNVPMIVSETFINELKHLFELKHIYIHASTVQEFEHDSCSGKKEWMTYPTLEVHCIFWDDKG